MLDSHLCASSNSLSPRHWKECNLHNNTVTHSVTSVWSTRAKWLPNSIYCKRRTVCVPSYSAPCALLLGQTCQLKSATWRGGSLPCCSFLLLCQSCHSLCACVAHACPCVFAGVAEQFAIAEAKLRAWSSVDGDESNDDSYDEDYLPVNEPTTQSTGKHPHRH